MLLVIADTSPLRYLVEIGYIEIEILLRLFEKILIPTPVYDELRHPSMPQRSPQNRPSVRAWAHALPLWLEVVPVTPDDDDPVLALPDKGEKAAISLGHSLHADVILMTTGKALRWPLRWVFRSRELSAC
jgi:predicted nucleic acid-binding protein